MPNPGSLIFNAQTGQGNPTNQTIFFSSSDNTLSLWRSPRFPTVTWLKVVSTGAAFALIGVDQTGLGTGTYNGSITVTQAGAANSPVTVPVVLVVNGGGGSGGGTLSFSPSSLSFSSVNGSVPAAQTLSVSATSTTSFVATIGYVNGSGWLTVNPTSGVTTSSLSVSANPAGLATGTYSATISFNANGSIQNVGVTLTVNSSSGGSTGNVTVSPTSLTFTAQQGSSPAAQNVSVSSASGSTGVAFTVQVTSGSNFLSTSANANPTTPYSFTASVNSNSLSAGTYNGNIRLTPSGGTVVDIPVTLTITAPPTVSASPTSLTFNYTCGRFRTGIATPHGYRRRRQSRVHRHAIQHR